VEAVERSYRRFVVGVQWHPENQVAGDESIAARSSPHSQLRVRQVSLSADFSFVYFPATSPKIGGYESHHKRESNAELPEDVFRVSGMRAHGVEEMLDEMVARRVQITPVHKLPDFRRSHARTKERTIILAETTANPYQPVAS